MQVSNNEYYCAVSVSVHAFIWHHREGGKPGFEAIRTAVYPGGGVQLLIVTMVQLPCMCMHVPMVTGRIVDYSTC